MENTNKFEDEIDFKDVMTNPKRWFGFYYLLLIVGIVLGGVYYLKNINNMIKITDLSKNKYMNGYASQTNIGPGARCL